MKHGLKNDTDIAHWEMNYGSGSFSDFATGCIYKTQTTTHYATQATLGCEYGVYLQAERVLILKYCFALKLSVAVHEAFSNAYPDTKAPNTKTILM
jgi:hypothetical protein